MRLEFNEKQQHFHLAALNTEQNTFGWATIGVHHEYILTLFISHTENCFAGKMTVSIIKKNYEFHIKTIDEIFSRYDEFALQ